MKITELGKTAAEAELLLLQRTGIKLARKTLFFVLAALFGLAVFISFHALLWVVLLQCTHVGLIASAALVMLIDIVCAGLFIFLGCRKVVDEVAIQARISRDYHLQAVKQKLALTAVVGTLGGPLGRFAWQKLWELVRCRFGSRSSGG